MVTQLPSSTPKSIIYPDSDGQPMADNTKQFELIVWIKNNLELLFANDPNVFVAGDLLWYSVEDDNKLRQAPDVMVVFGRPKGYRGSYKQWLEDNIAPQVVFEIWSPGNRISQMAKKFEFYERYGVEEYYLYEPDVVDLTGWQRRNSRLEVIDQMAGWVSPRLGVRFELGEEELQIYRPDGDRFLTHLELDRQLQQERERAEQQRQRAEQAEAQLEALHTLLKERGINPEQL
ncbi:MULTISPECIES: Uma2 family endonuclease [Nostoc]|uniref:Uma2 family endonuclease n=1 Tax=Nostoc paludosum FACHB-159 TaxID=2692908 RepID=A0ABR8K925_9NOSO|nr:MULTISPECIES: Uma2 family endonuclease [Nostoc]MBD2679750.1 Uma2 family endonuclease [Nostoc sp. FACHB-857]MBD2735996.1 Uma2 family endonuclease [Nostoc paludosum FACHB-159]